MPTKPKKKGCGERVNAFQNENFNNDRKIKYQKEVTKLKNTITELKISIQ